MPRPFCPPLTSHQTKKYCQSFRPFFKKHQTLPGCCSLSLNDLIYAPRELPNKDEWGKVQRKCALTDWVSSSSSSSAPTPFRVRGMLMKKTNTSRERKNSTHPSGEAHKSHHYHLQNAASFLLLSMSPTPAFCTTSFGVVFPSNPKNGTNQRRKCLWIMVHFHFYIVARAHPKTSVFFTVVIIKNTNPEKSVSGSAGGRPWPGCWKTSLYLPSPSCVSLPPLG